MSSEELLLPIKQSHDPITTIMAVLGKRKALSEPAVSEDDAAAIFRRHFEAQFNPLPELSKPSRTGASKAKGRRRNDEDDEDDEEEGDDDEDDSEDEEEDDDSEGEWGGLSEDDDSDDEEESMPKNPSKRFQRAWPTDRILVSTIEVVDHSGAQPPKPAAMSKRELKAFMVRSHITAESQSTQAKLTLSLVLPPS